MQNSLGSASVFCRNGRALDQPSPVTQALAIEVLAAKHVRKAEPKLVEMLGAFSPVPVTYAGGATALADLDRVNDLGAGRVDLTIGSALDIFGGDTLYRDVVAWQRRQEAAEGGPGV